MAFNLLELSFSFSSSLNFLTASLFSSPGNQYMSTFGLWPLEKGHSHTYSADFDPGVTNEFGAAAFRFGHSMVPGHIHMLTPANTSTHMRLRDMFFKPEAFQNNTSSRKKILKACLAVP